MDLTAKATILILIVLCCCGTVLNGLVIFVFARSRRKHASTTYILILAFVDFCTCAVTIPLCVTMEILDFETDSDALCKSYHLLATTTVPLSAMLMGVIAIDRYIRICTNNAAVITTRTIFNTAVGVVLFCLVIGSVSAMGYGVEKIQPTFPKTCGNISESSEHHFNACEFSQLETEFMPPPDFDLSFANISFSEADFVGLSYDDFNESMLENINDMLKDFGIAICKQSSMYFDENFIDVYSKIYSMVYVISCLITIVMYCKIYYFIASRRKQNIKRYKQNVILQPIPTSISKDLSRAEYDQRTLYACSRSESVLKNNFMSKREKMRRQNIKTASMLASVAFVFTASFLPAWLMKYRFLPFNDIAFHLYFIYCVINPLIYAFCNSKFKTTLKQMISSRRSPPFIL